MKKQLLLLLFIFSLSTLTSQELSSEPSPADYSPKGFGRWSLMGEFGQNMILPDGESNFGNMYGGAIEYGISPTFGFTATYLNFNSSGNTDNPRIPFATNLQSFDFGLSGNLTKLILPRSKSKFNIGFNVGVGQAFYTFDLSLIPKGNWLVLNDSLASSSSKSITIPLRFFAEYDLGKTFSLGAKFHFNVYAEDNLEGARYQGGTRHGSSPDYITGGSLFLRVKIAGKNKEHLRNVNMVDFYPDESLEIAREVKRTSDIVKFQTDSLNERVAIYNNRVILLNSRVDNMDGRISEMFKRTESIELLLSNDGADADKDGVPDHRDIEPNTPLGVAVDFWGKALPVAKNTESTMNMDSVMTEMSNRMGQTNQVDSSKHSNLNIDSILVELTSRMNQVPANKCCNCDSIVNELSYKVNALTAQTDSLKAELANREAQASLNAIASQTNLNVDSILSVLSARLNQDNTNHIAKLTKVNVDSIVSVVASQTNQANAGNLAKLSKLNVDSIMAVLSTAQTSQTNLANVGKQTNLNVDSIITEIAKKVSATSTPTVATTRFDNLGTTQSTGTPIEYIPQVYFGYDKVDLDEAALITISKIAHKLSSDPALKVEVRGYCDMSGNVNYNIQLSKRRAERVREELINSWGIEENRVVANGGGTTGKVKTTYGPNRRCDFFFTK